ncbi:uncharacterized protein E0L32_001026 [Thyridium curvatum]|uniref:Pre-mRNA splicing factor CLF1 n=1 Tax=Thyridium curvatum TaxID=1093900 RepID=A0A507B2S7_9PEZI|nr:uncharacterized protein E0L32_001026 [Thyridium curvatum]TPX11208.1 hypothetical protein E0L32_001026 [Thyridium curvatum]
MSLPKPVVPLDNICSVIFQNTLYTFSAGVLQSLELVPGANWTQLATGEPVKGGACVGSTNADQAGFWVVGGTGASPDYKGLQKFTYSTKKWESIKPSTNDLQGRLGHGAAYLTNTNSIVVYAGVQGGAPGASSQTFTVSASAPYGTWSVPMPANAPLPALNPMLLPWTASQVVLVGGSAEKRLMLFDSGSGWIESGATLAAPLAKDVSVMKSVVMTGDDNSKHLLTFDMSVSPNQVTRSVLIDGKGLPVHNSGIIVARSEDKESRHRSRRNSRRQAKSLTSGDWPKYNATLAPTATRSNFALAQDSSGLVVAAGGNPEDILCMFDARTNSWQNASAELADQKVFAQSISSSSSSTTSTSSSASSTTTSALLTSSSTVPASTSATPTPTASETVAPVAAASTSGMMSANTMLGIVLGSIGGLGAILLIIYICIRRRRAKRQNFAAAGHNRRSSGASSGEKDGFGFANDIHPPGPRGTYRGGHQQQGSENSFSSMAILMNNVNQNKSGLGRNNSKESKRSSTSSIFNKAFKSTISKPIPQMAEQNYTTSPTRSAPREERGVVFGADVAQPRPAANRADPQDGTRRSSGWNRYWSGGSALNILGFGNGNGNANSASKHSTVLSDESSQYSNQHRITQDSATVPPLQIPPVMPEAKPQFSRVNSGSPTISRYDPGALAMDGMRGHIERPSSGVSSLSAYSSGIPASVHEAWDPTSVTDSKPWGTERAPSSAYSGNSFTTPLAPASASNNAKPAAPSGVSRQPQLAMAATSSDMSWLNLGDQTRI